MCMTRETCNMSLEVKCVYMVYVMGEKGRDLPKRQTMSQEEEEVENRQTFDAGCCAADNVAVNGAVLRLLKNFRAREIQVGLSGSHGSLVLLLLSLVLLLLVSREGAIWTVVPAGADFRLEVRFFFVNAILALLNDPGALDCLRGACGTCTGRLWSVALERLEGAGVEPSAEMSRRDEFGELVVEGRWLCSAVGRNSESLWYGKGSNRGDCMTASILDGLRSRRRTGICDVENFSDFDKEDEEKDVDDVEVDEVDVETVAMPL
ncbi:hypothetical protein PHYBLDRAFT_188440 [Phycomyces blakesleeanus NRRL 1555(-)]|uniref:Uncharacterized protein n=1 Tax=Phycomyces blakesleeanus (strain ATCC 8743b / DSM 1359 / FGSC 10004 / NBRC 33097 / NRRL 1555) TaxID=763407 RepID=A0A162TS52_PHYB8|nr:hypothetical protein PHYBLDRAFT_188440 [Phycomyces blakesleeanus NRRL 1555(-)]OAD69333.1 hypothetical protein PHYBLDRAFT_188440 [Phycomyces blakesleeanus NRRL 1555(-)]|eukprot:XP_018287373.1 hypothetical protein PHYBLDRAFT_188440 [Phycomyces blakesleeanus NRRL 1555(-)]